MELSNITQSFIYKLSRVVYLLNFIITVLKITVFDNNIKLFYIDSVKLLYIVRL